MIAKLKRVIARFPTYLTYIRERPSWVIVLLFGRVLAFRSFERAIRRAGPRPLSGKISENVAVANLPDVLPSLLSKGVYADLILRHDLVSEIANFAATTPCTSRSEPVRQFLPSDINLANHGRDKDVIAAYYFDRVNECPAIGAIERDAVLNDIAAAYIGTNPIHIRTRLWWSFPATRFTDADLHAAAQDRFHFDLNDFRTLKFFFYITDVDSGGGPHSYISGSHRKRKLKYQFNSMVGHDEASLRRDYPGNDFKTITGAAGTGFIEDPFIFHLGQVCQTRSRLVLEIEFGPYNMSESYRYGMLG